VSIDRQHWSVLLRFWLGVAAARGGLYRGLSGNLRGRAAVRHPAVLALDRVPRGVWRRHDQDARRYLVARLHGDGLSSPNPADAQSAESVGAPETAVVA